MSVKPYSHEAHNRKFAAPAVGIKKKAPTAGSKTQKRKHNKESHMKNNTAGMR